MRVPLAYGRSKLEIEVPDDTAVLQTADVPPIPHPGKAVREALAKPIGAKPLGELARRKAGGKVCLVVSDITRPVPYAVMLPPLLEVLETSGVRRNDIVLLIATGMHRPSTAKERLEMFGTSICERYRIVDHVSTDDSTLVTLPKRTSQGTQVSVNRTYVQADLKIATGLVEPHFMAGYSGGRKAICPGIVNLATIQKFHGPGFLEHPCATSGVLQGNPCHQEASDVAHIAGVDFLLNVALSLERKIVGVFAGDLDAAFGEAVRFVDGSCRAQVLAPAELVLTSGGGHPLDTTLYQVVKGMVGAIPVVKEGGAILIAAECGEGIGSPEYKDIMLEYAGRPEEFLRDIKASDRVRKDQWELEMQCKVLAKVGIGGLVLVTRGIPPDELPRMSLTSGYGFTRSEDPQQMVQDAFDALLRRAGSRSPKVVAIPEGPYVLAGCRSAARPS
jgi:nickel-dependent lactate racemase